MADDGWQRFPVTSDGQEVYLALRANLVALEDLTYKAFSSGAMSDLYKLEQVVEENKILVVYFKRVRSPPLRPIPSLLGLSLIRLAGCCCVVTRWDRALV